MSYSSSNLLNLLDTGRTQSVGLPYLPCRSGIYQALIKIEVVVTYFGLVITIDVCILIGFGRDGMADNQAWYAQQHLPSWTWISTDITNVFQIYDELSPRMATTCVVHRYRFQACRYLDSVTAGRLYYKRVGWKLADTNLVPHFEASSLTLARKPLEMSSLTLPPECLPSVYLGPYSGAGSVAIGFSLALWGELIYVTSAFDWDLPSFNICLGATCMQMYVLIWTDNSHNWAGLTFQVTWIRFLYFTKCVFILVCGRINVVDRADRQWLWRRTPPSGLGMRHVPH